MSSKAFLLLFARLLMSSLFVWDGVVQLRNPGGTARYFASIHAYHSLLKLTMPIAPIAATAINAAISAYAESLRDAIPLGTGGRDDGSPELSSLIAIQSAMATSTETKIQRRAAR